MGFLNLRSLVSFLSLMSPRPPSRRKQFGLETSAQWSPSCCTWSEFRHCVEVFIVFIVLSMSESHLSFTTILRRWAASASFLSLCFLRIFLSKHLCFSTPPFFKTPCSQIFTRMAQFYIQFSEFKKLSDLWSTSRSAKHIQTLLSVFQFASSQVHFDSGSGIFFPAWVIHHFWGD